MKSQSFLLGLLFSTSIFTHSVYAQDGAADLAQAGPDAGKLAEAYLAPIFKGFGIGLNSGWANTAHSKNLGRFELRLSVTGATIPGSDKTFNVNTLGLSNNLRLKAGESPISPTVAGSKSSGPKMEIYSGTQKVREFDLPQGTNVPIVPAPQLQGTLGLIKGIDISLRAIPQIKLGDKGSLGMLGGGIKVELLPLIAGKTASKILPFDVAIALGYSRFSYEKELDYKSPNGTVPDNQKIEAKISGINTQVILSKKLLLFTPFVAFGTNSAKTEGGLKGDYRVATTVDILGQPQYNTVTDPVKIDKKNFSSFRSDIGFQLNLAVLRIYGSYSMSEYNSFNAGIGLGIGK